jgi:L-fucose isomerase-like protein
MTELGTCILGVVPTRRDVFKDTCKVELLALTEKAASKYRVKTVGIEGLVSEGLLFENSDVPKIAAHLQSAGVDAVFIPHANFGQEEAVAKLCKILGKPVLLWGPRDMAPKGVIDQLIDRPYDIQCGLFATSRALMSYDVPFTYIENCWIDSPVFEKGFEDFIRTVCAVRAFKQARIGQLSVRPQQFLTVKYNESELLERFGIEVVPIAEGEVLGEIKTILERSQDEIEAKIAGWKKIIDLGYDGDDTARKLAAANLAIHRLAEKYQCTAMAGECWSMLQQAFGINACYVWGTLSDDGLPITCENDIIGALTSLTMAAVGRGETPPFFADLTIRHPENDNAELLWHCGPFPPSLAKSGPVPTVCGCKGQFEIRGGEITLGRIGASRGNYLFFADMAKGVPGPKTNGTYLWVETNDWPRWERKLIYGPYIHHIVGIHGSYKEVIREALRYLGNIEFDSVC